MIDRCSVLKVTKSSFALSLYLIQNIVVIFTTILTLSYLYFGDHFKCEEITPQKKKMIKVMLWMGLFAAITASGIQLIFLYESHMLESSPIYLDK
jgi:uncharacterized PurR-regulated membrane protein YhhQ (DUF165 family)